MTITELTKNVEYLTDATGQRKAVVIDLAMWEQVVSLLEDLEDTEEMRQALQEEDEIIPWDTVKADYLAAQTDV